MYTSEALRDMHERGHRSLQKLLVHCNRLSVKEMDQEVPGFGYPSVRLQLYHLIAAEEYWIGVLLGSFDAEDKVAAYPTVQSLEIYREQVAAVTDEYLRAASPEELNTLRPMLTWQNKERLLMPAHVFMRTLTHIYQHQGQVLAMCRMMGRPGEGMDFPITK